MLRRGRFAAFAANAAAAAGSASKPSRDPAATQAVPKFDPAAFGLTDAEVREKAKEAAKPYKFKSSTNKSFTVQSSTKAQAELVTSLQAAAASNPDPKVREQLADPVKAQTRALEERQKAEAKKKRRIRFGAGVVCAMAVSAIGIGFLLPAYGAHTQKQRTRQRRYEEVYLPSMERLMEAQARGGPGGGDVAGWGKFGEPRPPPRTKPSVFG